MKLYTNRTYFIYWCNLNALNASEEIYILTPGNEWIPCLDWHNIRLLENAENSNAMYSTLIVPVLNIFGPLFYIFSLSSSDMSSIQHRLFTKFRILHFEAHRKKINYEALKHVYWYVYISFYFTYCDETVFILRPRDKVVSIPSEGQHKTYIL